VAVEVGVGIDVDVSDVGDGAFAATGTTLRLDREPPDVTRHVTTPATARNTTTPISTRFIIPAPWWAFLRRRGDFPHGEWPEVRLLDHVLPQDAVG
jgi:hypothetical protein